MRIWVDADSCPIPVRSLIIRFSLRLLIPVVFVANRPIPFKTHDLLSMVICSDTPDAADDYIVEHSTDGDLIITRDIPLADRLVKKDVTVINDRGCEFTSETIGERLSLRNFNMMLCNYGFFPDRINTYGKKELSSFANNLDRTLQKLLKNEKKQNEQK